MENIYDLLMEETEYETDNVLESVIVEEAVSMISSLSEGAIAKIGLKVLTKKERQEKMLSGEPVNSATHVTYDIVDVHKEIKAVEWYLGPGKKNLTPEQESNLKAYLGKLRVRFSKLGGRKELDKVESDRGSKKIFKYAVAKTIGGI